MVFSSGTSQLGAKVPPPGVQFLSCMLHQIMAIIIQHKCVSLHPCMLFQTMAITTSNMLARVNCSVQVHAHIHESPLITFHSCMLFQTLAITTANMLAHVNCSVRVHAHIHESPLKANGTLMTWPPWLWCCAPSYLQPGC